MANKDRRVLDKSQKYPTIISVGSSFNGVVKGASPVILLGKIEGDCEIENTLNIEKTGVWVGSVRAQSIIINGSVEGDVFAEAKLEVGAAGKVKGNVTAETLVIASGAVIQGEIIMEDEKEPIYFEEKRNRS